MNWCFWWCFCFIFQRETFLIRNRIGNRQHNRHLKGLLIRNGPQNHSNMTIWQLSNSYAAFTAWNKISVQFLLWKKKKKKKERKKEILNTFWIGDWQKNGPRNPTITDIGHWSDFNLDYWIFWWFWTILILVQCTISSQSFMMRLKLDAKYQIMHRGLNPINAQYLWLGCLEQT